MELHSSFLLRKGKIVENISFKERVKNIAIECSSKYRDNLCNYEYLVISDAFTDKYCIISAEKDNYMHLIGVNSQLSAQDFYQKCIDNTLTENDFDFNKKNQSEKSVKGSVREKIVALPSFCDMFTKSDLKCQQDFSKGKVKCNFASASDKFTIGFVQEGRPKSLMKNNQLDDNTSQPIIAVLRRIKGATNFTEMVLGSIDGYEHVLKDINSQS